MSTKDISNRNSMKVSKEAIYCKFDELDRSLSNLTTISEADVKWSSVPNSELEIVDDHLNRIERSLNLLYNVLLKYPR